MAGFDLTQLVSDLGDYYRVAKPEILSKMYAMEEWRKYFNVIPGVQDTYVMTEMEITEVIQPYQKGWTPKGDVKFTPETIKARDIKVDLPLDLKDMEKKWIGYLKTNGSSPEEFPFVAYIYQRIIERIARDLNKTVINGEYAAVTPGTAGAALASFDGILKVVEDAVTAGKITEHTTGALANATIIDQVEGMYDSLPADIKELDLVMLISPDWRRNYFRAKRADFGGNVDYQAANPVIDFTNTEMWSPTYMNGSDKLIITPKENLIGVEDGINEEDDIRVQMNRRTLELMVDLKRGVGFGIIDGYVFANDGTVV
jgi:hypothetical protein